MKKIIRAIYLVLAFLFLGIGIAGIVLPILPTTPFLLLTAALFAKSSEKESVYETLSGIYPTENTILEKIRQTER